VVLIILAGVVATVSWQWSAIAGLYQNLAHIGSKSQTQANHETPSAQPKFSGRVPQDQSAGPALAEHEMAELAWVVISTHLLPRRQKS
jgi:hypothetical protein